MSGLRLVAHIRVQPGKAERFVEAWRPHLTDVAREPGCVQYELFQSRSDPDRLALLEHWESRELFETHWQHELQQDGGAGVASAADLIVDGSTEIYDHQRFVLDDGGRWHPQASSGG